MNFADGTGRVNSCNQCQFLCASLSALVTSTQQLSCWPYTLILKSLILICIFVVSSFSVFPPVHTGFFLATSLLKQVLLILHHLYQHLNPACYYDPPISSLSPFFGIQP